MAVCKRCGNEFGVFSSLVSFNFQKGRCNKCEAATRQALIQFREAFLRLAYDGTAFTYEKFKKLEEKAAYDLIDLKEALEFIRRDAINLLERVLDAIVDRGQLTDQAENYFRQLQHMLGVLDSEVYSLLRDISFLNIYRGKIPVVPQDRIRDIRLDSDETCYLLTQAKYHRVNKTTIEFISGRLVATNKKLRFLSEARGIEILLSSIMSIKEDKRPVKRQIGSSEMTINVSGIYLEVNKRTGSGFYSISDAEMAEAIIDTLVRIAKGQAIGVVASNSQQNALRLQQRIDHPETEPEKEGTQSEELGKVQLQVQEKAQVVESVIPQSSPQRTIEIFYSYAHKDENLRDELEKHLSLLKRQGYIINWHDRKINPGQVFSDEIDEHLNTADIILLLVSPDFMDSDYCYSVEMQCALERHEAKEVIVIPVILRKVHWKGAPFGKLQALPTDAKPVNSRSWRNQDEAFYDVAEGIKKVVEKMRNSP